MKKRSAYIQLPLIAVLFFIASCGSSDPSPSQQYEVRTPTYKYSITNWDNGWTSTIKTDWVEVVKGCDYIPSFRLK